ncbi:MAG: hypothetical protein F4065_04650 [Rhodothermaceae bacterium]|nr:hypothetical protein [Rhodothermaceae bacterium]MXZ59081.1 hypothetical protein [Rhodothermaceae bacterium]MYB90340.1 hypothetical protein [Rhodothermaceae bacterium]MYD68484.1 hypothetical protein [Rhodothermaceae bacterium]MYG45615.1 hypothetical protein [Rhodothermaceae bacterium]
MFWRTLNRKTVKFFQNKHVARVGFSAVYPLISLWTYWRAFDGNYTGTDILWGVAVTIILASAIYLYLPIAKKVERGSIIWFLGLLTIFGIFTFGTVLAGFWTHWIIRIPVEQQAWGEYITYSAIWIPAIHTIAKNKNKLQLQPHEIIPRVIPLFKGPAAWNKAER